MCDGWWAWDILRKASCEGWRARDVPCNAGRDGRWTRDAIFSTCRYEWQIRHAPSSAGNTGRRIWDTRQWTRHVSCSSHGGTGRTGGSLYNARDCGRRTRVAISCNGRGTGNAYCCTCSDKRRTGDTQGRWSGDASCSASGGRRRIGDLPLPRVLGGGRRPEGDPCSTFDGRWRTGNFCCGALGNRWRTRDPPHNAHVGGRRPRDASWFQRRRQTQRYCSDLRGGRRSGPCTGCRSWGTRQWWRRGHEALRAHPRGAPGRNGRRRLRLPGAAGAGDPPGLLYASRPQVGRARRPPRRCSSLSTGLCARPGLGGHGKPQCPMIGPDTSETWPPHNRVGHCSIQTSDRSTDKPHQASLSSWVLTWHSCLE